MSWPDWLRPRRESVPPECADLVEAWRRLAPPEQNQPLSALRWVVVDTESGGIDPHRDALLSIGGCVVRDGEMRLNEVFERVLRQSAPSASENILIHGIAGQAQLDGDSPQQALAEFLAFFCG